MAKITFGEYAAFDTQGGVRFMKNSRLVSENSVPPEVVSYLRNKLAPEPAAEPIAEPRFAPPTEEEKAKLRAESLKVPPELARTDAEMEAARQPSAQVPLAPEDFEQPSPAEAPLPSDPKAPDPEVVAANNPTLPYPDPDFMEAVSIHTASIFDIAEALYNRFGLYTVYLSRLPLPDEINPLSGEVFSKYHHGIAYQAAIRAQHSGVLDKPPEGGRAALDEGRAASENLEIDTPPATMGAARRANSFDYRTSVRATQPDARTEIIHVKQPDGSVRAEQRTIEPGGVGSVNGAAQRFDADEDQPIVEPQMGKQVVRPNW